MDDLENEEVKTLPALSFRNFDEVPQEHHKEISLKAIKECLRYYHQLGTAMYPKSSAVHRETVHNFNNVDALSMRMDVDRAISTLSLKSRKIIILLWIMQMTVTQVCYMLGYKHRVDVYRRSDEAYEAMYQALGDNWLRSKGANNEEN